MTTANLIKSPRWGLNLSDESCFWCRKVTGRKVIHGLLDNDEKAPDNHFRDYVPCKTCGNTMSKGITIIQCATEPNNNQPLKDGLYPTGAWVTISEDWIRTTFKPEAAEKIIKDRAVNVTLELWERLGLPKLNLSPVTVNVPDYVETNFVAKA